MGEKGEGPQDFIDWDKVRQSQEYAKHFFSYIHGWLVGSSDEREQAIIQKMAQHEYPFPTNQQQVIELFRIYGYEISEQKIKEFESLYPEFLRMSESEEGRRLEQQARENLGLPPLDERSKPS